MLRTVTAAAKTRILPSSLLLSAAKTPLLRGVRASSTGNDKEKMAAVFGAMAKGYEKLFMNSFPMFNRLKDLAGKDLGADAGQIVLDLGSGPGEPGISIAKAFPNVKVLVTDNAPGMVEKAHERAAGIGNVEIAVASADDLSSYADNSIDVVTMCYVLMFVPDQAKAISEIARVLKPGGAAHITVWKEMNLMGEQGVMKEAVVKFCSTRSFQPPPPAANPMACSADDFVEDLVMATSGVETESTENFTTAFNMGHVSDPDIWMMFAVNSGVKEYEDQGNAGAIDDFIGILHGVCDGRGYTSEDGVITIPDNVAQILTMRKK